MTLLAAAACAAATEPEAPERTRVLVAWHSETNRTGALGMMIAAAASEEAAVKAMPVDQVTCDDLTWADGIALGSPVYWGTLSGGLKTFLDDVQNKCFGWPARGGAAGLPRRASGRDHRVRAPRRAPREHEEASDSHRSRSCGGRPAPPSPRARTCPPARTARSRPCTPSTSRCRWSPWATSRPPGTS